MYVGRRKVSDLAINPPFLQFNRPAYQDAAVAPFLYRLGSTYQGFFNPWVKCLSISFSAEGSHSIQGWSGLYSA